MREGPSERDESGDQPESRFAGLRRKGPAIVGIFSNTYLSDLKICLAACVLLLLCGRPLSAQRDSISLGEVTVRGIAPERYQAGLYVQNLDSAILFQAAFRRLDEVLTHATPLTFRNYGNGQLSTLSFRGLSASHTAVLWNGVNINQPGLGQTDFSAVPAGSFERIAVQYGAGASHLGTDAVGGSVLIENSPMKQEGLRFTAGMEYGSFGNGMFQGVAKYRTRIGENWQFAGKTQYYQADYLNKYPASYLQKRRVEPSTTFQKGFFQDLFLQGRNGKTWSAHLWLSDNRMTLWPDAPAARELTGLGAARTMIRYGDRKWQLKAFYIRDIVDYATGDYSIPDRSRTGRLGTRAEREWRFDINKMNLTLLAGGEYAYFDARVKGYEAGRIGESRGDVFLLTRLAGNSGWSLALNARQAFVEGYGVPFTPSFGFEYPVLKKRNFLLKLTTSVARSYRVPTLNERYWKDLGNPGIRPESGWNKEAGTEVTGELGEYFGFSARVNAFHNQVSHWIYWNPATNYRAENILQVVSRGAEFISRLSYRNRKWIAGFYSTIGYTKSTQEKAYDAYSREVIGKQLRFVPLWLANWSLYAGYGKGRLTLQLHQESLRYTTSDNSQYLPAYRLLNVLYEHQLDILPVGVRIQGRVLNAGNELYFNVKSNGMPGRSYHVSLLLDGHVLSKQP